MFYICLLQMFFRFFVIWTKEFHVNDKFLYKNVKKRTFRRCNIGGDNPNDDDKTESRWYPRLNIRKREMLHEWPGMQDQNSVTGRTRVAFLFLAIHISFAFNDIWWIASSSLISDYQRNDRLEMRFFVRMK